MTGTTYFDGTYIKYTCPHCGQEKQERADPRINPEPFAFLQYRCSGCGRSMDLDWDVIDVAQAAALISSGRPSCGLG